MPRSISKGGNPTGLPARRLREKGLTGECQELSFYFMEIRMNLKTMTLAIALAFAAPVLAQSPGKTTTDPKDSIRRPHRRPRRARNGPPARRVPPPAPPRRLPPHP